MRLHNPKHWTRKQRRRQRRRDDKWIKQFVREAVSLTVERLHRRVFESLNGIAAGGAR